MLFFFVWRKEKKWPSAARGLQLDLKQKQCLNFLEKAIKRFYSKNTELHQGKNSDCIWDLHELWKKMEKFTENHSYRAENHSYRTENTAICTQLMDFCTEITESDIPS
ncbi:hypothetical protein [Bacillus sp. UMB0893]|uniref:hypothetical protein n=1 Tax=Bacillus sp. UMB0893 TaxID=2066053 RepID=UPI000C77EACC|nr:hypothetical protein [Bacillus sp. UMB0893]